MDDSLKDSIYLKMALVLSARSQDPATKVGAILVKDDRIIGGGVNGVIEGGGDELVNCINERPEKYRWMIHAEENTILTAARFGVSVEGSVLYVTHIPCSRCARMIVQSGIKRVVHAGLEVSLPDEKDYARVRKMFEMGGVRFCCRSVPMV